MIAKKVFVYKKAVVFLFDLLRTFLLVQKTHLNKNNLYYSPLVKKVFKVLHSFVSDFIKLFNGVFRNINYFLNMFITKKGQSSRQYVSEKILLLVKSRVCECFFGKLSVYCHSCFRYNCLRQTGIFSDVWTARRAKTTQNYFLIAHDFKFSFQDS